MSKPPVNLHMGAQQAQALLDPIHAELNRIEARLQNYLDRLTLSDGDAARIAQARETIAHAAGSVGTLKEESRR